MSAAVPQFPSNPAEDQGPELKRLTIVMCVIATLLVVVRLNVRAFIVKAIGWDDYVMTASAAVNIAAMIIVTKAVDNGLGKHMGDALLTMPRGLFWVFVDQSLLVATQVLTKLSVGLTLLRIAVRRRYRVTIWITSVFMVVYLLVMLFIFNLQCKDVRANWDPTVPRECIPQGTMVNITYIIGSCNILTDLVFAIIIPFPMIWSLNTNKRIKASAMFVISLGALACAASIARMPYLVNFGSTIDSLWAMAPVAMWTVVETEVAIIAACIPSLKPLVKSVLDSSFAGTFKTRRANGATAVTSGSTPGASSSARATYPNSKKEFTLISERTKSGDGEDSDGAASERNLVQHSLYPSHRTGDIPLSAIQKITESTVSVMPMGAAKEQNSVYHSTYAEWQTKGHGNGAQF